MIRWMGRAWEQGLASCLLHVSILVSGKDVL